MTTMVEVAGSTELMRAVDRLVALEVAWIEHPGPVTAADYLEAALAVLDLSPSDSGDAIDVRQMTDRRSLGEVAQRKTA